jgi:uncharacterized protein
MKLHLDSPGGSYQITGYGPGFVRVNEQRYARSLLVFPDKLIPHWSPVNISSLCAADMNPIIGLSPEIVLIGTGSRHVFPDAYLMAPLIAVRVGVETMDTFAACRTYNILLAEGRRVAAALIIEPGLSDNMQ